MVCTNMHYAGHKTNLRDIMTLLEKTMKLIERSGKNPTQLANETGLGVRWMYRLIKGDYQDPSVNKIETIYNHLNKKKLLP